MDRQEDRDRQRSRESQARVHVGASGHGSLLLMPLGRPAAAGVTEWPEQVCRPSASSVLRGAPFPGWFLLPAPGQDQSGVALPGSPSQEPLKRTQLLSRTLRPMSRGKRGLFPDPQSQRMRIPRTPHLWGPSCPTPAAPAPADSWGVRVEGAQLRGGLLLCSLPHALLSPHRDQTCPRALSCALKSPGQ